MRPHCVWEIPLQSTPPHPPQREDLRNKSPNPILTRATSLPLGEKGRSTSSSFLFTCLLQHKLEASAVTRGSACQIWAVAAHCHICLSDRFAAYRSYAPTQPLHALSAVLFSALETTGAISLDSSIEVLFNFRSRRIPISTSALSAKLRLPSHVSSSGQCLWVLHPDSPANPPAPLSVPDSNRWIISARTNVNPTT